VISDHVLDNPHGKLRFVLTVQFIMPKLIANDADKEPAYRVSILPAGHEKYNYNGDIGVVVVSSRQTLLVRCLQYPFPRYQEQKFTTQSYVLMVRSGLEGIYMFFLLSGFTIPSFNQDTSMGQVGV